MLIAVATGMDNLDDSIKKLIDNEKQYETVIVNYKEFFEKKDFNVVILSPRLAGKMSINNQLFFILRRKGTRIIYLTNEDDVVGIKKCFQMGINDILLDPVIPSQVLKLVKNPNNFSDINSLYLKYSNMELEKNDEGTPIKIINESSDESKTKEKVVEVEKIVEKTVYKTSVLKQKILTFYTTDNSFLTSDLITQVATLLDKHTDQKVLVLDFNTLFPCLHHYFGVDKEIKNLNKYDIGSNTSLSAMYNALRRKDLNPATFKMFVKEIKGHKNINLCTGLYDLVLYQKMSVSDYEKIINVALKLYDTILINTNPCIDIKGTFTALTLATNIMCVTEGTFPSAENLLFVIKNLSNTIPIDKFKIVVSNMTNNSLDKEMIEKLFEGINVIGYLPYNKLKEDCINNSKIFSEHADQKEINKYLDILTKLGYIPETNNKGSKGFGLFNNLFGKKGGK